MVENEDGRMSLGDEDRARLRGMWTKQEQEEKARQREEKWEADQDVGRRYGGGDGFVWAKSGPPRQDILRVINRQVQIDELVDFLTSRGVRTQAWFDDLIKKFGYDRAPFMRGYRLGFCEGAHDVWREAMRHL